MSHLPRNHMSDLYIDLMKKSLLHLIYDDEMIKKKPHLTVSEARESGLDWPQKAYTMIGMKRLNNVQYCIEQVLENNIPGDFIETGVWRGGSCIFMRSLLKIYGDNERQIWVADSFRGVPPPNSEKYPEDKDLDLSVHSELSVSQEQVAENFRRYDLLDDQVEFLEGWFKDTLPNAPIESLAILRLDGDLYESTMDALNALYPKLSPGGYVIIDDYGAIPACKQAVTDYREQHNITAPITEVDWTGVYWQKPINDRVSFNVNKAQQKYIELYNRPLKDWIDYYHQNIVFKEMYWEHIPILNNPMDLWIYQDIIFEIKPDFIIEIGSFNGGSTLFLAQQLDRLNKGNVISVDINRGNYQAEHQRIITITGDSGSDDTFNLVKSLVDGKTAMLIHDGNHEYQHVLHDMRRYAELISLNSYMVIEDSIVDIYANDPNGNIIPFNHKGPLWSIEHFLIENSSFIVDESKEHFWITYNQRGFLKRVKI